MTRRQHSMSPAPTPEVGTVVRLSPAVAEIVEGMAADMGGDLSPAQVIRRGLILLDFYLTMTPSEVLAVYDLSARTTERVTFDFEPAVTGWSRELPDEFTSRGLEPPRV